MNATPPTIPATGGEPSQRAQALAVLAQAIAQWRDGELDARAFATAWRDALRLGAFSERAHAVSEGLLTRIESAQNFSGESCSFSTRDMQSAFRTLLEKLKTAR